jgi:hypothetical protein
MKITKSQLKQIIKEELDEGRVKERWGLRRDIVNMLAEYLGVGSEKAERIFQEKFGDSNEQEYVFVVANADSDPYGDPGRVTIKGIFRTEEEAKRHTSSPVEDEVVKFPLGELFFWP